MGAVTVRGGWATPAIPYVRQACGAEVRSALLTPGTVQPDSGAGSRRSRATGTGPDPTSRGSSDLVRAGPDREHRGMPVRVCLAVLRGVRATSR